MDDFLELIKDDAARQVNQLNDNESQSKRLSDITERRLEWLWPGKIPIGKPTLMGGDPGKGKTMVALDIAARVSTGNPWPDGARNKAGKVLILTAEDDLDDTIVPRLRTAGANLDRIFALETVEKYDPETESITNQLPNLVDNLTDLENEIDIHQPKLIIIDPLNGFLPGVDTHRDAEMRSRVFAPMKQMLQDSGAALIYIVHLNKSGSKTATHRIMGSMANIAAARSSWIVADDKDSNDKLMVPDKFNIAEKPKGMSFKIIGNKENLPVVAWSNDPVDTTADEALSPDGSSAPERDMAQEFVLGMLENGPVPAKDIYSEAEAFEISKRTLMRAKSKLKVKSKKIGAAWKWYPPQGCQKR